MTSSDQDSTSGWMLTTDIDEPEPNFISFFTIRMGGEIGTISESAIHHFPIQTWEGGLGSSDGKFVLFMTWKCISHGDPGICSLEPGNCTWLEDGIYYDDRTWRFWLLHRKSQECTSYLSFFLSLYCIHRVWSLSSLVATRSESWG